jgi:hypothetical protein
VAFAKLDSASAAQVQSYLAQYAPQCLEWPLLEHCILAMKDVPDVYDSRGTCECLVEKIKASMPVADAVANEGGPAVQAVLQKNGQYCRDHPGRGSVGK